MMRPSAETLTCEVGQLHGLHFSLKVQVTRCCFVLIVLF